MKPGITPVKSASLLIGMNCTGQAGWAQVNGWNAISWEDKFKLDVWYVDKIAAPVKCASLSLT